MTAAVEGTGETIQERPKSRRFPMTLAWLHSGHLMDCYFNLTSPSQGVCLSSCFQADMTEAQMLSESCWSLHTHSAKFGSGLRSVCLMLTSSLQKHADSLAMCLQAITLVPGTKVIKPKTDLFWEPILLGPPEPPLSPNRQGHNSSNTCSLNNYYAPVPGDAAGP